MNDTKAQIWVSNEYQAPVICAKKFEMVQRIFVDENVCDTRTFE